MSLTHINCHFFRGERAKIDTSSFVALNPRRIPGSLVVAGSTAARESIGSQVACRLALEHFVDGVLDFYEKQDRAKNVKAQPDEEISLGVLEAAFKRANSSVYHFGHQLAAGGKMAASLIGLVIEERIVAAGRVASGSAYLLRGGELFPFFESGEVQRSDPTLGAFVGANALVAVELASVPIQESDTVIVFSRKLNSEQEGVLLEAVRGIERFSNDNCAFIVRALFPGKDDIAFSMTATIGPETIYLNKALNGS